MTHQHGAGTGPAAFTIPNEEDAMNPRPGRTTLTILLLAAGAGPVLAHTGTDAGSHHGFLQGLLHPFTGIDHLAAILALGFSTAAGRGRAWIAAAVFAAGMLGGALLAMAGVAMPAVEPMIAVSLLVFGLLAASRARLPALAAALPAGLFAVFHGAAHGTELAPASAAPLAGMLAGTLLLLALGTAAGHASRARSAWWARCAGAVPSLLGAALLMSMAARG